MPLHKFCILLPLATLINLLILICSAGPLGQLGTNPDERGDLFEGDIMLPADPTRSGLLHTDSRWPNARLFYEIDSAFTENEVTIIKTGMQEITDKTCIQFEQRTSQPDWIHIINHEEGCWSYVGRLGGRQELNLNSSQGCVSRGVIIHELVHGLGFYHEQSRTDRDCWVTINFENIDPNHTNNFKSYDETFVTDFQLPYDYDSVMHYSRFAFTVNGKETITPKNASMVIGKRRGLSGLDGEKLRRMYKLDTTCQCKGSNCYQPRFTPLDLGLQKLLCVLRQLHEKLDNIMYNYIPN